MHGEREECIIFPMFCGLCRIFIALLYKDFIEFCDFVEAQ